MFKDTQEFKETHNPETVILQDFVVMEISEHCRIREFTFHEVLFEVLRKYYKDRVNENFKNHNRGAQDIIEYLLHKINPICEGASKAFGREYTWRAVRMNFIHDSIETWFKAEAGR